jgi:hypothetical protein
MTMSGMRSGRALLGGVALLLAACGGEGDGAGQTSWDARGIAESQEDSDFIPIILNSPLGVGPNRVAVALTDGGELLAGAQVSGQIYRLADDPDETPKSQVLHGEMALTARSISAQGASESVGSSPTVYIANVEFDVAGWWGLSLDVDRDGELTEGILVRFWVREQTSEPGIGEAAPRSEQVTMRDVEDVSEIDSTRPPNPAFHELTIAEALDSGRPVVVAFLTPAFCQTRFCGPVMQSVIVPISAQYGDRVEVVHVEPFDLAGAREGKLQPVAAVQEWGLLQEPFVFVIAPDGTVAAKFEGIMEAEEVASALDVLLAE